jgi:hypothetical protein
VKKLAIISCSFLLALSLIIFRTSSVFARTDKCDELYGPVVSGRASDPSQQSDYEKCVTGDTKAALESRNSSIPEVNNANKALEAAEAGNNNREAFNIRSGRDYAVSLCGILSEAGCGLNLTSPSNTSQANRLGIQGDIVAMISQMYSNPPASSKVYVADLMKSMNIASPAYAQGIGFASLSPILSVWKVFRNIAYLGFVIIFLVIGLMIMFRQKISGQAVVTAQQALPSIIIALLAVTFSYAIAGLLIDGMYIIMFLLAGLFGRTDLINGNIFQVAGKLIGGDVAGTGANALGNFINTALGGGVVGALAQVVTSLTAAIVILLVIIFNTFKLFISLLKVYVELIIAIVFAPVLLMLGALPGKNMIGPWIKSLIANLAVFPTILFFLILFEVLRDSSTFSSTTGGFMPPYFGGYGNPQVLPFLAGLALILGLPTAVDEVKKQLGGTAGGIFATIMQAGAKNALKTSDTAIPLATGIGSAVYGAARGYDLLRRNTALKPGTSLDPKMIREAVLKGFPDEKDPSKRYGGIAPKLGQGISLGQTIRRLADDASRGELGNPNTLKARLERYTTGNTGAAKK